MSCDDSPSERFAPTDEKSSRRALKEECIYAAFFFRHVDKADLYSQESTPKRKRRGHADSQWA